ncbi:GUN4 domain-containing protein [Anabaena sphaerica FACHB-251]|uniref:GUN4 domain-containing protein n=1 Tax=Anabaena sphaerica FACHB-251 TaxID=2692883 RepID=A0A927A2C8_9NOST|nr:GUN4 domain-containing protein [Anabaena sphaerica FACHB-251]
MNKKLISFSSLIDEEVKESENKFSQEKQTFSIVENITIPSSEDDLSSEKEIDYTKLRDLLKAGSWKEADYETYMVMLQAVGRKEGDLRKEERLNFPSTDLYTIDRLWTKYSNGNFGFSVQKKILLRIGGKSDGNYQKGAWEQFSIEVRWKVNKDWIFYGDLSFDTSMPVGHLPRRVFSGTSYGRYTGLYLLSHRDL